LTNKLNYEIKIDSHFQVECGNQFSYKEKLLSFSPKYRSIKCNVCGTK